MTVYAAGLYSRLARRLLTVPQGRRARGQSATADRAAADWLPKEGWPLGVLIVGQQ
jgi:hypothetical protein